MLHLQRLPPRKKFGISLIFLTGIVYGIAVSTLSANGLIINWQVRVTGLPHSQLFPRYIDSNSSIGTTLVGSRMSTWACRKWINRAACCEHYWQHEPEEPASWTLELLVVACRFVLYCSEGQQNIRHGATSLVLSLGKGAALRNLPPERMATT